ncbi:Uncharacterised protein [Vibrio cholerae]|nr:Uncharacterised protein [Vibrio cholerae]
MIAEDSACSCQAWATRPNSSSTIDDQGNSFLLSCADDFTKELVPQMASS